ncbi:MAG: hypothetical protein AVDCRST_MAG33-2021 [uncultured Thermomicrobiales bacterium]|uniref:Uncharacterized protein n=1 Tax=uncultured Thermomicrobiales bacterium TaxID=1645740 RepID=A0A6J4V2E2_9BACT|nr:MAG: hypothetical protein AVDCRST_MAG33-2021 [uncultured Thermomicrobiales bacterium]
MIDVDARTDAAPATREPAAHVPRVIAPHVPVARDIVSLYAARVASTGADISPALRQRRASLPTTSEPVIGYLAAPMPTVGCPAPVGRGTATHRQALDALSASQWATRTGWLPEPDRVRVTRAAGGIGRPRPATPVLASPAPRPSFAGRLAAALSAFARPAPRPDPGSYEPNGRMDPQTA